MTYEEFRKTLPVRLHKRADAQQDKRMNSRFFQMLLTDADDSHGVAFTLDGVTYDAQTYERLTD